MSSSVAGSFTTNLSSGERPVCWAVSATRGPSAASTASPRLTAISTRRAGGRFQYAVPRPSMPCLSNPKLLTAGPSFCMPSPRRVVFGKIIDQEPRHDPDARRNRAVVGAEGGRVKAAGGRPRRDDAEAEEEAGRLIGKVGEV